MTGQGLTEEERLVFRQELLSHLRMYGLELTEAGLHFLRSPHEVLRSLATIVNPRPCPEAERYFAGREEVQPRNIRPLLVPVDNERDAKIFRHALSFWRAPVSSGYGRRMRYIVWDKTNGKVIGVLGLSDPVIGLRVRDEAIGWDRESKEKRLWHGMTAHVLGAVPPYNLLLGGKLVALLATSSEVAQDFVKKYGGKKSLIRKEERLPVLAFIDTMGAFGKSAIYTRLPPWRFVGYTAGQTHYHLTANGAYEVLKSVLDKVGEKELLRSYKYGKGPNWKFRVVSKALRLLGISDNILDLGLRRGYYLAPLVENWRAFLAYGEDPGPSMTRPAEELICYWKERWLPKGLRRWGA